MRLTADLIKHIDEIVTYYSKRLNIEKPKYVLRVKDVLSLPREITKGRRTSAYRYYGVAYIKHKTLFFNVKLLPTIKRLDLTIVHELVHLRFPYLKHGSKYRKKIQDVIDGKTFKPYRKREKYGRRSRKTRYQEVDACQ
jgi:predicted metal-dependent hydrolase